MKPIPFEKGQIRHPRNVETPLLRVLNSESEVYLNGVKQDHIHAFLPLNSIPKLHFVVLDDSYNNFITSEVFWLVYMITHSTLFDNFPIEPDWIEFKDRDFDLRECFELQ